MPETEKLEKFVEYISKMKPIPKQLILAIQVGSSQSSISIRKRNIEVIILNELLNNLTDFREYQVKIKQKVESDYLSGSELTLKQTYVESRFNQSINNSSEVSDLKIEEAINNWLDEPCGKQLAILGEYGQGKSSTALMFTYHLLEKGIENLDRIPILLELRGKAPSTMTAGDLLGIWSNTYGVNPRHLEALHEAGRLLFIFDGFDEMALMGNQNDRLKHFQTLWSFNHSQAKLIFTGRPNLFLDDHELKAALGIQTASSGKFTCEAWHLEKFNVLEIEQALRNAPENIKGGITRAVSAKNSSFIRYCQSSISSSCHFSDLGR